MSLFESGMVGREKKPTKRSPRRSTSRPGSKSDESVETSPAQERAGLESPSGSHRRFVEAITDDLVNDAADGLAMIRTPSQPITPAHGIRLQDIGLPLKMRATTQKVNLTGFIDSGEDTGDVDPDEEVTGDGMDEESDPDPTEANRTDAGDDEDTLIEGPNKRQIERSDTDVDEPPKKK